MKLRAINGSAQKQETDQAIRNLVLTAMEAEAPILNHLEFYPFVGTSDNINPDVSNTAGQFRTLNNPVAGVVTNPAAPVTVGRKIFGDSIKTDRALIDQYGTKYGVDQAMDIHENSLIQGSKALARYFTDVLINGDGLLGTISGLKTLITGDQLVNFIGENGGLVPFGNSDANVTKQQQLIEKMNAIIYAMKPTCIQLDSEMLARLESIARTYIQVSTTPDAFGANQRLLTYAGIPLVDAGYKKDDSSKVIGTSETCGTSVDKCTSIYFIKCAERDHFTIGTTDTGLKVIHNAKDKNFVSTDIELQYEPKIVKVKSAVRLQGIFLA